MARLLSVNVGLPREVAWRGKTVITGVWKAPVGARTMVRRLNIEGDGQGDLAGHGGEQRAVLVYQVESYEYWKRYLGRADFSYGQFGENFTVEGLSDAEVCIGDRYRIGDAVFEVSQPRVTCYRIGIRMENPEMAALLVKQGRPGFYLRVIEEGMVGAGDEIICTVRGPGGMSVAGINALLYLPGHPQDQLEKALRIPALSEGWKASLEALLTQKNAGRRTTGNAGLAVSGPPPAWAGFRPLRVAGKLQESDNVVSILLQSADGRPLVAALPGQHVVLRMGGGSANELMRSYSLSGPSDAVQYRISVKVEAGGAASRYLAEELKLGDLVDVSAARGEFTLRSGEGPVILLSAGIGITPLLAMLHDLVASGSKRDIWWLHGARNGREDAFASEARGLLDRLEHGHGLISFSAPGPEDRQGGDFDVRGRLDMVRLKTLGLPLHGDFYICGPPAFMHDLTEGLATTGVAQRNIHTEFFGAMPSLTPGVVGSAGRVPHAPADALESGPIVTFARSGLDVHWDPRYHSLLELAEACDVPVRWACRTGVCHTCESALVTGSVDYSPDPLDPAADGNVLICCSQPLGDIVIEL
jgi:ferredoxin-NADP reductase/MOSC domain-containing protein YiiM